MKTAPNWRRVFISASVISILIIEAVIWLQTLSDNALRTGADFISFYTAGQIAKSEGFARVYQPELQRAIQQAQVGFALGREQILLYNHLPYVVPLTMLVVDENYAASFVRWNVLMLMVLGAAASLLVTLMPGVQRAQAWLAIGGSLLFFPAFYSLVNGQDTALLFIGAVIGVWGLLKQRDTMAGLGLSLVTIRPHIALLFAIPFFFKRRKIFWGFAIGATALALFSVILIGPEGTRDYLHILSLSAGGEWHGMQEEAMFNLLGLVRRLMPALTPQFTRALAWGVYGAAILFLSLLWFRAKEITEKEIGLLMIVGVFAAPHLHYHDLTLLLIPLILALRIGITHGEVAVTTAAVGPLAGALLFLVAYLIPLLKFTIPYLVMPTLLIWLWQPTIYRNIFSSKLS